MPGLLDALGYLGDSLNKPGRAVRGLLGGRPEELLAALPFSDSAGLTDPENQVSGRNLLDSWGVSPGEGIGGDLAGLGAEVATDPLTLGGGLAGRLLGKTLTGAAAARGPRYGTTAEELLQMADKFQSPKTAWGSVLTPIEASGSAATAKAAVETSPGGDRLLLDHLHDLLGSPARDRVLAEIQPGSQFIGRGVEGMALRTPAGDVTRIGREIPGAPGRPAAGPVLPTTRAIDVPAPPGGVEALTDRAAYTPGFRVERMPAADLVGDEAHWGKRDPATMLTQRERVTQDARSAGLDFYDRHAGNLGLHGGRPVVIDPGAVRPLNGMKEFFGDTLPVAQAQDHGRAVNALIDALGGDAAVRRAIESGQMGPNLVPRTAAYGAAMGGAGGLVSRAGGGR